MMRIGVGEFLGTEEYKGVHVTCDQSTLRGWLTKESEAVESRRVIN